MSCNNSENVTRSNGSARRNRKRKKRSCHPQCDKKAKQSDQCNSNLTNIMSNWAKCCHVAGTWQYKHEIAYWKALAKSLQYENKILHNTIKKIYFNDKLQTTKSREEAVKLSEACGCENIFEQETEIEDDDEVADSDGDDDDDFEVSEEFIEFLKQNARHKEDIMKEKQQLKAKAAAKNQEPQIEDEKLENSEEKQTRFIYLYGADWERIMALETSSVCHFINECDKDRPKYWPNIPFNFD